MTYDEAMDGGTWVTYGQARMEISRHSGSWIEYQQNLRDFLDAYGLCKRYRAANVLAFLSLHSGRDAFRKRKNRNEIYCTICESAKAAFRRFLKK